MPDTLTAFQVVGAADAIYLAVLAVWQPQQQAFERETDEQVIETPALLARDVQQALLDRGSDICGSVSH